MPKYPDSSSSSSILQMKSPKWCEIPTSGNPVEDDDYNPNQNSNNSLRKMEAEKQEAKNLVIKLSVI